MKPTWQPEADRLKEVEKNLLKQKNKENKINESWSETEWDENYFESLHDKIMLKIEETEIKPKPLMYTQRQRLRRALQKLNIVSSIREFSQIGLKVSVTLSALFFGLFVIYGSLITPKTMDPLTRAIVQESERDPAMFSDSMLNSQTSFDLVQELAKRSDKSLNTNDL